MDMTPIEALTPGVVVGLVGVPEPIALHAIRQACSEFCSDTGAVVFSETVSVPAGATEFTLTLPAGLRVARIVEVRADGALLPLVTALGVGTAKSTDVTGYTATSRGVVTLYGFPDGGGVRVLAALTPTNDATSVPTELVERYIDALELGARARLRGQSGTAWYDPKDFAMLADRFRLAKARARVEVSRHFATGVSRVAPHGFV